jgi:hypothetical protein
MKQISCEACRSALVETTVDSDEPQEPFRVCRACAHRLEMFSLRPLEWYNLAAVHGPSQFLLHDDFYDEDGTACQPEEDVAEPGLFPAPILEEVSGDIERLLEYARTRWFIEKPVVETLSRHSRDSVLRSLQSRVAADPCSDVKVVAYEICAQVLYEAAEDGIRAEWESFTPTHLLPLAQASAACLPNEEGYGLVVKAIADVPSKEIVRRAAALSWFRSEVTLDWIERNISDPLLEDWGRLAAVSNLKWERVAKWLASGRPLSLVALDALIACWHYNTPILKQFAKLLEAAPVNEMNAVLNQYLSSDSSPRVRRAIASIASNWEQICKP